MVIGIGIDMIEIKRIQKLHHRYGDPFYQRLFTPLEIERASQSSKPAASLAKRFAAKEAFVKALGIGFQDGISFQDIEILNDAKGQPYLDIKGQSQKLLHQKLTFTQDAKIYLSLSDTCTHAVAQVLIFAQEKGCYD